ncbi:MAG: response regulator [Syntrophales bacterium]
MSSFRVLVVDDESDFVETIVNRLHKRKVEAIGVPSGEAAMELIKEKPFDVVLLDIKMPGGMDGIEVLREIKKIQPLTEVVLLTGHASVETSVEGLKLGAFDYLLKPVKFAELLEKLVAAFEKKNAQEQKIRGAKIQGIIRIPGSGFE